ncbi:hypothetical protein LTR15_010315 [Elasticomyces elasticus]|nr:hypothetical protein LTR15_010315 [Elasticomyces elasticus]
MHFHRLAALGSVLLASSVAYAQSTITLGRAGQYAVFGGTSIVSSGITVITPRIATSPGTTITGFGLLQLGLNGGQDANNAAAQNARTDLTTLYNTLAALPVTNRLTGILGGVISVLTPGVYNFPGAATLNGVLTFDGQGNANSVFVIQVGTDFTSALSASVLFINGAQPCNVFYQVGGSAVLGAATAFAGNLIALGPITANAGSTILLGGGLYSLNAGVNLFANVIDPLGACGGAVLPISAVQSIVTTVTTATSLVTLPPQTITLPAVTTTVSGITITAPPQTITAPGATVTSLSVVTAPAVTITAPAQTITLLGVTVTLPAATVTLPPLTVTAPPLDPITSVVVSLVTSVVTLPAQTVTLPAGTSLVTLPASSKHVSLSFWQTY